MLAANANSADQLVSNNVWRMLLLTSNALGRNTRSLHIIFECDFGLDGLLKSEATATCTLGESSSAVCWQSKSSRGTENNSEYGEEHCCCDVESCREWECS